MSNAFHPTEILRALLDGDVRFIVVGGVAAALAGSPLMTQDLDVVYDLEASNVEKLMVVLRQIHARYRDPARRLIFPDSEKLVRNKVNLLMTDLGPLDLLREVGDALDFHALADRYIEYELEDKTFYALDVETLIEAKEFAGRPKDLYGLPFLRALIDAQDGES